MRGTASLGKRSPKRAPGRSGSLIVLESSAPSPRMQRRLLQAAAIRVSIEHPNLLRARAVSGSDGRLHLALAPSRAPSLTKRLQLGPLDPVACALLVDGLADASDALARAGLVSHNFAPARSLVDPVRGGILADSGIAPDLLKREPLELDPELAYRSPEELEGRALDARSTVYSLGALLFTALTGAPPYGGAWSDVYASHLHGARPRPTRLRPELPTDADAVLGRAMAIQPSDRYARASELARAAAKALGATLSWDSVDAPEAAAPPSSRARTATPAAQPAAKPPQRRVPEADAAKGAGGRVPDTGAAKRAAKPHSERDTAGRALDQARKPDSSGAAWASASKAPAGPADKGTAPRTRKPAAADTANGPSVKPAAQPAARRPGEASATAAGPKPATRRPAKTIATPAPAGGTGAVGAGSSGAASVSRGGAAVGGATPRRLATVPQATARGVKRGLGGLLGPLSVAAGAGGRAPRRGLGHLRDSLATLPRPAIRPSRVRDRARPGGLLALVGVAVLACGALGVVLGRQTGAEAPPPPQRVAAEGLTMQLPLGWERMQPPWGREWTRAYGDQAFLLSGAVAARPANGSAAGMVAGSVRSRAVLERVLEEAGAEGARREAVRLGSLDAWRYRGLRPSPGRAATAYLAPTTGGSVLVVCYAGAGRAPTDRENLRDCSAAATTVDLKGGEALPLSSIDQTGPRLERAVETLRARRARARRRLAAADLARGQAARARALERSYARAVTALEPSSALEPGKPFASLIRSLGEAEEAYGRLARAAERSSAEAYRAAARSVVERERAVAREIARVAGG